METNEAAAALLNMESPNNILDEKRMSKLFCIYDHILSMRSILIVYSWFVCVSLYLLFLCSSHLRHSAGVGLDIRSSQA